MGIPKFYRFICERYPCVQELIKESQVQEFDNLYLDMNGIIHACSHSDDESQTGDFPEEEIFKNIFSYLDVIFYVIKPKKLLFLAVDGVAPRAKMNQQRGRRFKTAKEKEALVRKMLSERRTSDIPRFDSNCITPGTGFMIKLQKYLEYYVANRISYDSLWGNCKVILSGHEVPGEGEHKIMEYIRYMQTQPDYDPCLRHCLYGLDADLLILGLCTHEKNFCILREEIIYGRKGRVILRPENTRFCLTHLSLMKEYLDLEFQVLKKSLPFGYSLDSIIDDWVLMSFIVGNDFIPNLPDFHIHNGSLQVLYRTYIEVLPTLDGYMNENGYLNLRRFHAFMEKLAKSEESNFVTNQFFLFNTDERANGILNPDQGNAARPAPKNNGSNILGNLDEPIAHIEEFFHSENNGFEDTETDEEFSARKFKEHKRNYYATKMKCFDVTKEFLKSQAEEYVRGLQWILHYYYHGCQSWSWYYPEHYAPCPSDILNFIDTNLEFEMGRPLLPYEQLLAVLPPGSKDLLPAVYRDLMLSPDSPIKKFYPIDFDTDLNGKQRDYEAIVLLPMMDEKVLLDAMKIHNDHLTPKERDNNKHGPMLLYSYANESLGVYRAPEYFKNISDNHASLTTIWRDELAVNISVLQQLKRKSPNPDVYFLGFPTFKYVDFKADKRVGKVKVFNHSNKVENITLTIEPKPGSRIDKIAGELLGETVYVNWPFLSEARIIAMADGDVKYSLTDTGLRRQKMRGEDRTEWTRIVSEMYEHYLDTRGIDTSYTDIIVYVNSFKGIQTTFDTDSKWHKKKIWSQSVDYYPLETIVRNLQIYEPHSIEMDRNDETFPLNSLVFLLSTPYYGCIGRVIRCAHESRIGRCLVKVEVPYECEIDREELFKADNPYVSAAAIAAVMQQSPNLLGKIAGSIVIDTSSGRGREDTQTRKRNSVNIGLCIKSNKTSEKVPGYAEKTEGWKYSDAAAKVIEEYIKKFPIAVRQLVKQPTDVYRFHKSVIFPGQQGNQEFSKILNWLKNLECNQIPRVSAESEVLKRDVVIRLVKATAQTERKCWYTEVLVTPQNMYRSELHKGDVIPVETNDHRLLDRVVCSKPFHAVPLGMRGYIIGIVKFKDQENMYDILFDAPFTGGMVLNCCPNRGYRMSMSSFINISEGERNCYLRKQVSNIHPDLLHSIQPSENETEETSNSESAPDEKRKLDKNELLTTPLENGKPKLDENELKVSLDDFEEGNDVEARIKMFFEENTQNAEGSTIEVTDNDSLEFKDLVADMENLDNITQSDVLCNGQENAVIQSLSTLCLDLPYNAQESAGIQTRGTFEPDITYDARENAGIQTLGSVGPDLPCSAQGYSGIQTFHTVGPNLIFNTPEHSKIPTLSTFGPDLPFNAQENAGIQTFHTVGPNLIFNTPEHSKIPTLSTFGPDFRFNAQENAGIQTFNSVSSNLPCNAQGYSGIQTFNSVGPAFNAQENTGYQTLSTFGPDLPYNPGENAGFETLNSVGPDLPFNAEENAGIQTFSPFGPDLSFNTQENAGIQTFNSVSSNLPCNAQGYSGIQTFSTLGQGNVDKNQHPEQDIKENQRITGSSDLPQIDWPKDSEAKSSEPSAASFSNNQKIHGSNFNQYPLDNACNIPYILPVIQPPQSYDFGATQQFQPTFYNLPTDNFTSDTQSLNPNYGNQHHSNFQNINSYPSYPGRYLFDYNYSVYLQGEKFFEGICIEPAAQHFMENNQCQPTWFELNAAARELAPINAYASLINNQPVSENVPVQVETVVQPSPSTVEKNEEIETSLTPNVPEEKQVLPENSDI